jgi:hypothetical protein
MAQMVADVLVGGAADELRALWLDEPSIAPDALAAKVEFWADRSAERRWIVTAVCISPISRKIVSSVARPTEPSQPSSATRDCTGSTRLSSTPSTSSGCRYRNSIASRSLTAAYRKSNGRCSYSSLISNHPGDRYGFYREPLFALNTHCKRRPPSRAEASLAITCPGDALGPAIVAEVSRLQSSRKNGYALLLVIPGCQRGPHRGQHGGAGKNGDDDGYTVQWCRMD